MKYILLNTFYKSNFQLIKYWGNGGQEVGENEVNDTAEQVHVFKGKVSCKNSRKVFPTPFLLLLHALPLYPLIPF